MYNNDSNKILFTFYHIPKNSGTVMSYTVLSHIILIGAQLSFSEFQLPNQLKPLIGYPVKPWELYVLVRSCR